MNYIFVQCVDCKAIKPEFLVFESEGGKVTREISHCTCGSFRWQVVTFEPTHPICQLVNSMVENYRYQALPFSVPDDQVITPSIYKKAIEERLKAYDENALDKFEVTAAVRRDGKGFDTEIRARISQRISIRQVK